MRKALGIIETAGSSDAIVAADIMLKTADVTFKTWENFKVGHVTIFVEGSVSAVQAAVDGAKTNPNCSVFASYVIANPHTETCRLLERSVQKNKLISL